MATKGTYKLDKDRVKKLAFCKGLSLVQLAEEAELSCSIFQKERKYPSTIKKLADVLGVEPEEIIVKE